MRRRLTASILSGVMTLGIGGGAGKAATSDLEPGPGADVVMRACTTCHAIDNILQVRKNRADWDSTVHLMRNYGMDLSEQDIHIHRR